ncbi:MAG: cobalamin-binding protein [Nitrososphaerota archaeon]|nr:cobalamin-binding protein [Nitrososphaerota archaeon]
MSASAGIHQIETPRLSSPRRIVTTMPSATEIVSLLGLEQNLVGITHECDYPPSVRQKPVVMRSVFDSGKMTSKEIDESVITQVTAGRSIYQIDEDLLRSLKPELIITQELCEVCATPHREVSKVISNLKPKPNVLSLSPHNLEEVLDDIIRVGEVAGRLSLAKKLASDFQKRINYVKEKCVTVQHRPSVFCLEWMDPIYCSGHWMPELVSYVGGNEVLGKYGEPSTAVQWEQVLDKDPEVIFVTVCGYDVQRTLMEISTLSDRQKWNELRAVRSGSVYVLDAPSYYSRSGPRLVDGLEIIAYLLHPELFPEYKLPKDSAYSLYHGKIV